MTGLAICIWCNDTLRYGASGKRDLKTHAKKEKHKAARLSMKTNQSLPQLFQATKAKNEGTVSNKSCSVPYGTAPNVHEGSSCAGMIKPMQPHISILDRKSHMEAMTVSFVAEHSLPLSITTQLMKFGQEFSRDIKATKDLTMQRTTASYKLKEGLSEVIRKRLVADLQSHKLSMNMDECTSTNNKKVLSVLVSYFSDELNKCIVHHYLSTSLTVVKATIIHSVILDSLKKDNIPLDNLISNLSDSANYMRGKTAGFETLLRSSAPHLLDIDGDTCHHIHNSVRKFCSHFQSHVEGLCDDLFQDTRFNPDIKSYLEQLCRIVGTHYLTPLEDSTSMVVHLRCQ